MSRKKKLSFVMWCWRIRKGEKGVLEEKESKIGCWQIVVLPNSSVLIGDLVEDVHIR